MNTRWPEDEAADNCRLMLNLLSIKSVKFKEMPNTNKKTTGEKQYQESIKEVQTRGNERLGLMTSWAFLDDPKRLAFTFSRYKFVAKMLAGSEHVLEVGCGDGFVSRIVLQEVKALTAVDFDLAFVEDANARMCDEWRFVCKWHDMMEGPVEGVFDGIYSLDVLEHIPAEHEHKFIVNMIAPLTPHGVAVIGMPSLESQTYASPRSKEGHVNCKRQPDFKKLMQSYFHNVFMFSMNDEVVHTGYHAMSHYNIALCCGKK
jgi:2-polyprenyl-3-methyl-5-hydroxy-6-metoxy-1,4-benzoquinol methylase